MYQSSTPTPRALAWRSTSWMLPLSMMSQLASTSMYSQPISAARSTDFFCLAPSCGLGGSDHQLHATRPGLIHRVSSTRDGGQTSVTSVDSTIAPNPSPTTMTRHGISHGSVPLGFTSLAVAFIGDRKRDAVHAAGRSIAETRAAEVRADIRLGDQGPVAASGAQQCRERPAHPHGEGVPPAISLS